MSRTHVNPFAYDYQIEWSDEDKVYIASLEEFPFVKAHGESAAEAEDEIRIALSQVIIELVEQGAPLPNPIRKQEAAE